MADSTIKVNVVPELSGVKIEGLEELNRKLDLVISLLKPPPFKVGGFINKCYKIKVGDIVVCDGHGHLMTVDKIYTDGRLCNSRGEYAECVWHNDAGEPCRVWYSVLILTKLNP